MKSLNEWFAEYGQSHRDPVNKRIHWICVPAIFFSITGLLWSIPSGFMTASSPYPLSAFMNLATLASLLIMIFYLRLSIKLSVGILLMIMITLILCFLIDQYSPVPLWLVSLLIFIVAWIGQFYGHKVEGKKPSFLKDIQFLLIGPAWVIAFLYRKLGIGY